MLLKIIICLKTCKYIEICLVIIALNIIVQDQPKVRSIMNIVYIFGN